MNSSTSKRLDAGVLGLMAAPARHSSLRIWVRRAVEVGRHLVVDGDGVGAGVGEGLDVLLGLDDHQVQLERQVGDTA